MIKKQATNLAAIRKGDGIIAKVCKGDTLRYNSAHSITYILDGIVTPSQTKVKHNAPLTLSFTTETGKTLLPSTVRVTMGGVDITDTALRVLTNTIEIPSVTDAIEITAQAAAIPSGYVPLMYLRNTDTSTGGTKYRYFDTGFKPKDTTNVKMDVLLVTNVLSGVLFADGTANHFSLQRGVDAADGYGSARWGNGRISTPQIENGSPILGIRQTIEMSGGALTYLRGGTGAEVTKTIPSTLATPWESESTLLFGGAQIASNTFRTVGMCLHNFLVGDNDVLVRNYIPCKRVSDNFTGFWDLVNETFLTEKTTANAERADWIPPYTAVARTLTNCSAERLTPLLTSGTTAMAVIGSTWSVKLTPSSDYTFAGGVSPQVKIANVDVTSQVVTNNADGTYTITIVNVPQEQIEITAEAVALPYDAEVEYLQGDGTAYINLWKTLNSDTDVIDMDFFLGGATTTTSGVFGARTGAATSNFSILVSSTNSIVLDVNNGSYSNYRVNTDQSALNKRISAHLEKANKYVKYDLVLIASSTTASQSFTTNNNAYVFGVNLTEANANIKLCLLQWRRSGNLLFDLIPVRKNGIGYLYDKVSGQLFGNAASTGTFTFGSDVTSNDTNSLNLNNGLLGSTNGDEPNEIDPIAMEDM